MNSIIPISGAPLTMSSREIAELVNSRHDSVKRTIERIVEQGVIRLPPMVDVLNKVGQSVKEYVFSGENGKRDSIIVVAQLSPAFTGRLVDRWQELEAQAASPPPMVGTFTATLHLIADELDSMNQRIDHRFTEQDQRLRQLERENSQMRAMGIRRLAGMTQTNQAQIGLDIGPPAKSRGEAKGGTHASPRSHERQGYWRDCNGKRVWVRPTKVKPRTH